MTASTSPLAVLAGTALAATDPDWQPLDTQLVLVVQGIMPDGTTQYRTMVPHTQDPAAANGVVLDCADTLGRPPGGES